MRLEFKDGGKTFRLHLPLSGVLLRVFLRFSLARKAKGQGSDDVSEEGAGALTDGERKAISDFAAKAVKELKRYRFGLTDKNTSAQPCPRRLRKRNCPYSAKRAAGWTSIFPGGNPILRRRSPPPAPPFGKGCGRCSCASPTEAVRRTEVWQKRLPKPQADPSPRRRWAAPWDTIPSPSSSPATGWWARTAA